MIHVFDENREPEYRQSSKGNQLKFTCDGMWYKADYMGYEGLAEYTVSKLLHLSDLTSEEYVDYELEILEYNGHQWNGCRSRDFRKNWQLITLERLFKQMYGYGLHKMIYTTDAPENRLKLIVDKVEQLTGIRNYGIYMAKLLTIDALFLNEDRHTHNLAVLMNERNEFRLCPIFDHGAALLSDTTMDYPLSITYLDLIPKVKAATFLDSFEEQLDIAEQLYGYHIHFDYDYKDVQTIVDQAENYEPEIRQRVVDVIMQMRRKYDYLFCKR